MSREELKAEVLVVLVAGADTTGTSFSSIVTDILSSPGDYQRMVAEIDAGFAAGHLSHPVPTAAEVSKYCPFYVACIKEALRLTPSSPVLFPREVMAHQPPLVIDGKVIPVGTEISCSAYLANRDREIYGEDAETFRPDRWLEDDEKAKIFEKYNFTWGYGSRVCLGKDLAYMELMKGPLMVCLFPCYQATGNLISTDTNTPSSSFVISTSSYVHPVKKYLVHPNLLL